MGTRADFYIGRGEKAVWLGSIGWDGYPEGNPECFFKEKIKTKERFLELVEQIFKDSSHTLPEQGWPWPWEDSNTTDYSYAWDDDDKQLCFTCFGHGWRTPEAYNAYNKRAKLAESAGEEFDEDFWDEDKPCIFPDMTDIQNVSFGQASGVMVFRAKDS